MYTHHASQIRYLHLTQGQGEVRLGIVYMVRNMCIYNAFWLLRWDSCRIHLPHIASAKPYTRQSVVRLAVSCLLALLPAPLGEARKTV